jgi:hypothetical protein
MSSSRKRSPSSSSDRPAGVDSHDVSSGSSHWHLAPEVHGEIDPHQLMGVMFGKLNLLAYEGREPTRRNPAADAFAVLAGHPRDATTVTQLDDHRVRIDDRIIVQWTDDVDEIPVFVTV